MKYRYRLLELRRNRDNLIRFLEVFDLEPKRDFDKVELSMDEKLGLCAEITRIQKEIDRIESLPIRKLDQICLDYQIEVPSRLNKPQYARVKESTINLRNLTGTKWRASS